MSDTKRRLAQALKELMAEKPIKKITIQDIVERSHMTRQSFYYHFQDIYDLVEWACFEDASRALDGKKTYATWQEGFLNIFEAVLENKPFIQNVYHAVSREQVERYLYRMVQQLVFAVVEEQAAGIPVAERDKRFIADFYKYAFVGIMLDWVRDGMQEDPKRIVERISLLIEGDIVRALEKMRTDRE